MTNKRKWLGMLLMVLVLGMSLAGCDNSSGSDPWDNDTWDNYIPPTLQGTWIYSGKLLFIINSNGTGTIESQSGYSVRTQNASGEIVSVRFVQGSSVIGQFVYSLNGDGAMWIQSGTGPFVQWANLGTDGRNWVINKN